MKVTSVASGPAGYRARTRGSSRSSLRARSAIVAACSNPACQPTSSRRKRIDSASPRRLVGASDAPSKRRAPGQSGIPSALQVAAQVARLGERERVLEALAHPQRARARRAEQPLLARRSCTGRRPRRAGSTSIAPTLCAPSTSSSAPRARSRRSRGARAAASGPCPRARARRRRAACARRRAPRSAPRDRSAPSTCARWTTTPWRRASSSSGSSRPGMLGVGRDDLVARVPVEPAEREVDSAGRRVGQRDALRRARDAPRRTRRGPRACARLVALERGRTGASAPELAPELARDHGVRAARHRAERSGVQIGRMSRRREARPDASRGRWSSTGRMLRWARVDIAERATRRPSTRTLAILAGIVAGGDRCLPAVAARTSRRSASTASSTCMPSTATR